MAKIKKDETEIGITGKPIPKKRMSPKKRYEFEKNRRKHLGQNVGGVTYKSDVSPNYNPRTIRNSYEPMTFKEFMMIAEQRNAGPSTPVKFDPTMKQLVPNQGATRVGNVRLKKNSLEGV